MEYNINGTISFDISIDIEASSEEEALKKAKEQLKDYYHLDVIGANHFPEKVEMDLYAEEYED